MKSNIKVSIIVPIYNVEKYLEKCIKSLLHQDYQNVEIILINDGSTDNSLEICKKYLKNEKIKIFTKKNGGLSSARNYGLERACGEYIMFVDSDDWLDTDCVSKCIEATKSGTIDLIMFPYLREYQDGSFIRKTFDKEQIFKNKKDIESKLLRRLVGPINEELRNPQMMESNNTAWGKLYRKRCINNIKFIDLSKMATEDLPFNIQVFKQINSARYIESTFYHYNKTNTSSITKTEYYNLLMRWENLFDFIEKETKHYNFTQELNNRKIINLLTINMKVSMMNKNIIEKAKIIKKIDTDEYFVIPFENFQFDYLKGVWKIYYKACKNGNGLLILIMLYFANKLKKKS